MEKSPRFIELRKANLVYKLQTQLYGFKRAPTAWYVQINEHFKVVGFHICDTDPNLYVKTTTSRELILKILYFQDLILAHNVEADIVVKEDLKQSFQRFDLVYYYLDMEVSQKSNIVFHCWFNQ